MDSGFRSTNHVRTRYLSGQDRRISHRRRIWNRFDLPNQYVPKCPIVDLLTVALVAAQATSHKKDRAVVTGARNFFRTIGGAFGLASIYP